MPNAPPEQSRPSETKTVPPQAGYQDVAELTLVGLFEGTERVANDKIRRDVEPDPEEGLGADSSSVGKV